MKVIVCCENSNGMLFNNRRVSQDRVVLERIVDLTKSNKLWMDNYSYSLFEKLNALNISLAENPLAEAADSEYCFIDKELDVDLSEWKLNYSEEFSGNSHEKITMEVYGR